MIVLLKLLLAHLIGDFLLQPKRWVTDKEKRKIFSSRLYFHVFIHGALVILLMWDLSAWAAALTIIVIHWIIDLTKLYAQKENTKTQWFLIDQALHVISVYWVWQIFYDGQYQFYNLVSGPEFWLYTTAVFFLTFATGIIMQIVMQRWSAVLADGEGQSLADAGKTIGILERLFVFAFVVSGHWQAIGFLLAAKSVFRFGDLRDSKDRKLTEYILIGTLLSFGIAMATGMLTLKVSSLL